jgi:hypothetical protein
VQRRHAFPGLSNPSGSKAAFTAWNCASSAVLELRAHLVDLLDPYAVLAGDRPADLDASSRMSAANCSVRSELAGMLAS